MTPQRAREYARRLTPEDRAALEAGFCCTRPEPKPRKERARKPAPPHEYRPCTIYDIPNNEIIVRCRVRDCQDEQHRVRAALS